MAILELVPGDDRDLALLGGADQLTVKLDGVLRAAGDAHRFGNGTTIVDYAAEGDLATGVARRWWHSAIEVMGQHRLKVFPLLRPFLPSLNTGTIRFKERIR